MSKHTKEPWHYHRQGGPNIYAEDGTEVGQANYVDDGFLIAAAPDLLAACDALLDAQQRADAGRDGFGRYTDAVELARAAIAKAKGETK